MLLEQIASIVDYVQSVWYYVGGTVWQSWDPVAGGDLPEMVNGRTYIIFVSADCTLTYTDPTLAVYRFDLTAGRNDIVWAPISSPVVPGMSKWWLVGGVVAVGLAVVMSKHKK